MRKFKTLFFGLMVIGAALPALFSASPLTAASFPEHALELSIADRPGTALDMSVRVLAREAGKLLGQDIIPRNQPGGGGLSAVSLFTKGGPSARQGYNLIALVSNTLIFIPQRNQTPYLPLRDLEPILSFGQAAPILIGPPKGQPGFQANIDDFLAETRRRPGELRIGIPGLGTPSHIALAMISRENPSLSWHFVPFAGPGEAEAALLGGHIDAAASGALLRVREGQFTALMILAGKGLPTLPDTPCLTDKAFSNPGQGDSMFMLLAPSGVSDSILSNLESAFQQALQSDEFRQTIQNFSVSPVIMNRAETKAWLREAWKNEEAVLRLLDQPGKPATLPE